MDNIDDIMCEILSQKPNFEEEDLIQNQIALEQKQIPNSQIFEVNNSSQLISKKGAPKKVIQVYI